MWSCCSCCASARRVDEQLGMVVAGVELSHSPNPPPVHLFPVGLLMQLLHPPATIGGWPGSLPHGPSKAILARRPSPVC